MGVGCGVGEGGVVGIVDVGGPGLCVVCVVGVLEPHEATNKRKMVKMVDAPVDRRW